MNNRDVSEMLEAAAALPAQAIRISSVPVSEEDVAFFRQWGFLVLRLFDEQEIDRLVKRNPYLRESAGAELPNEAPGILGNHRDLHLSDPAIFDLCTDDRIVRAANALLGTQDTVLWRSVCWNLSAGERGQNYHQDSWPWWKLWKQGLENILQHPGDYCEVTFWLALNTSSVSNACLHVVPQSHKFDLDRGLLLDKDFQSMVSESAIPLEIPRGTAVIFNEKTLHGPGLAKSRKRKMAMAIRFMKADACDLNMGKPVVVVSGDSRRVAHDQKIERIQLADSLGCA